MLNYINVFYNRIKYQVSGNPFREGFNLTIGGLFSRAFLSLDKREEVVSLVEVVSSRRRQIEYITSRTHYSRLACSNG